MKPLRIALLGGGTGGHIYPLVAVANEIKRQCEQKGIRPEFHYLGNPGNFKEALEQVGIHTHRVISSKWRRYASIKNIIDIFCFGIGLLEAIYCFVLIRPTVIFSKGGPGTLPIILASRVFLTPLVIHDSDAVPGKSNRIASRFASRIELAFQDASPYFISTKTKIVGLPIRALFVGSRESQSEAKEKLGFQKEKPLLLITCGSQGATTINTFIFENRDELVKEFQILHQIGKANQAQKEGREGYRAIPYLHDDVATAFRAADLVLARAGATTLFELSALNKPAILVPLPQSAHNHQMRNALAYVTKEPAVIIEEKNLSIDVFKKAVENIPARREEGKQPLYNPRAAEIIAHDIIELATKQL